MRHQQLLRITTPKDRKPLWASSFREMLAKGGDGSPLLPPKFFHYDEHGRTLPGKPDIRIVGGARWVGILSQSGDTAMMDSVTGIASRLVGEHFNSPVPILIERPQFGVTPPENGDYSRLHHYFLRDMVIKRRSNKRRNKDEADLVRERLLSGLGEIADTYGFDLPPERAIGLNLSEVRCRCMKLMTVHGETAEAVLLANASFSMRANLAGIWQVGQLQARGYGRIVPCLPGVPLSRSVLEGSEVLR